MSHVSVNSIGVRAACWSSIGAEGSEGLTALFSRRCLSESEVEHALRDIAYYLADLQGEPYWLTYLPHALPLADIAAAIRKPSGDPSFSVCEFAQVPEFGLVEVRHSADPLRAAVLFAVWCHKSHLLGRIIKRRGAVYVDHRTDITGAPQIVQFIAAE